MIYGVGIDILEIERVKKALAQNSRFAERILTAGEFARFNQLKDQEQVVFLADRFSVKESYSKAYGSGLGLINLKDVETLADDTGRPIISQHPFNGTAHVSISHTKDLVMTEVILER